MCNLILWTMVTLDGFVAGPHGEIDWFIFDDELERYITETQTSADILLFGRVTYQGMAAYWPSAEGAIARFMNRVPKVVCSRTLTTADWHNTRLVRENIPAEVANLKQQPGQEIFLFGSATLAATLMQHKLIDEYRLAVTPVVLGDGMPLFKGSPNRLTLTLREARPLTSGVVILHYTPA